MIIRGTKELSRYENPKSGDVYIGCATHNISESLFLMSRGVVILPSLLAQCVSMSKVDQVRLLSRFMVPNTKVIRKSSDVLEYSAPDKVVTKDPAGACGTGVRLWNNVNDLYNSEYANKTPFVIQPYVEEYVDVRVIIIGDYVESYQRWNPNNFRNNISLGGSYCDFELSHPELSFCRHIMDVVDFPYAHIDLMISDGCAFLSELSLHGGVKGSHKSLREIKDLKASLLEQIALRGVDNAKDLS